MVDEQNLSNRDIMLELRADMKATMLGLAIHGERIQHIIDTQAEVKTTLNKVEDAADARIKALEIWRSRIMGIVFAIGVGASLVAGIARDALAHTLGWR